MAIVQIDLARIGNDYNVSINNMLKAAGIPTCLGTMTPILLKNTEFFDTDDISVVTDTVPIETVSEFKLSQIAIAEDPNIYADRTLTKEGLTALENYKQETAEAHVAKLIQCSKCELTGVCYKLTSLYMGALELMKNS